MKTRAIRVTNIPVYAYVTAYVDVPADTADDKLDEAVRAAVLAGEYSPIDNVIDTPTHENLDKRIVERGWEFDIIQPSTPAPSAQPARATEISAMATYENDGTVRRDGAVIGRWRP